MARQFFIYIGVDEQCTVKDGETTMTYEFPDVLEALSFVRRQRGGEQVEVTGYGPNGEIAFRDIS